MRALVKTGPRPGLELADVPVPEIGINDVLIRVKRTGICGTDLHIASWDPWAAERIAPPMVIGHEFVGEIVQVGTPSEIYEFPGTRFVADFIGSVNMFEGQLIEDLPDRVRIDSRELGGIVYVDHGISAAPGSAVWAAIRPEKINISRTAPAVATENCVAGVVKEIAYMGDLSIYLVKIQSGKMVRVTLPNIERLSDDERILWDENVFLSWHSSSPVVLPQ